MKNAAVTSDVKKAIVEVGNQPKNQSMPSRKQAAQKIAAKTMDSKMEVKKAIMIVEKSVTSPRTKTGHQEANSEDITK